MQASSAVKWRNSRTKPRSHTAQTRRRKTIRRLDGDQHDAQKNSYQTYSIGKHRNLIYIARTRLKEGRPADRDFGRRIVSPGQDGRKKRVQELCITGDKQPNGTSSRFRAVTRLPSRMRLQ